MELFPLKDPSPNFEVFREVLLGETEPEKVHFAELLVDSEVMNFITERMMGQTFPSISHVDEEKQRLFREHKKVPAITEDEKPYWKSMINFYYRMGYDYVSISLPLAPFHVIKVRVAEDKAILSRGKRTWREEKDGVIASWEDFEAFPWNRVKLDAEDFFKFISENLPEGMKISVYACLWEYAVLLFGTETMFRKLYLEPDLVKAVFDRLGEIVYNGYSEAVSFDCVGAIFHADDLGYKKGMMVKPETLRNLVFPWFKMYGSLAHQHGKMYWFHCCGNVSQVLDDLIEGSRIDAFHSFQDNIMPAYEFKKRYGDRTAILGGVDVDKLARYDEESLKRYVKTILDTCMPGGRYALGSGNSVTNYVPPNNYLTMLEEGLKWKPP